MNHGANATAARDDLNSLISDLEAEYTEIREFTPLSGGPGKVSQHLATSLLMSCCVTD